MSNYRKRKNEEYLKKRAKEQKKYMLITARVFYATLLIIFVIGLLFWLRPKTSDVEKRELTKFPTPTVSTFFNGEFFNQISTWYADTFPFREGLSTANAGLKHFYGITAEEIYGTMESDEIPDEDEVVSTPTPTPEEEEEENLEDGTIHAEPEQLGMIYIVDNIGFELFGFNRQGTDDYINMLNKAADAFDGIANVYDIVVPTSIGVNLDEENQQKIGSSSQEDTIDYVYRNLDSSITSVEVMDVLKKHNSEYLYFKTDHHWTADGAYYAYRELMKAKGMEASPLSDYTRNEYPGFIGTFYSYSEKSETLKNNPDTVATYTPQVNEMYYIDADGNEMTGKVVSDPTSYSESLKYLCFICGDQPYARIENPNITDGSSCVIIKESYGNAFVPFLVNSYQTVHVVDYRYYQDSLIGLVQENNIQDVIYLNNTNALLESSVKYMNQILKAPASTVTATPTPTPETTPSVTPEATGDTAGNSGNSDDTAEQ